MAVLVLPSRLSRFTESWRLANAMRGGVQSVTGAQQFVASAASRWEARLSMTCRTPADLLEADGFLAACEGSANPFLCGPVDWRGRPWCIFPLTGTALTPDFVRRSVSRDPGFADNPDTNGRLQFSLAEAAQMNATSLLIRRDQGGKLKRGQYFSVGQRLHIIISVDSDDPVSVSSGLAVPGNIRVSVRPWLRLDYPANTPLEFADPVGLMRLAPDSVAAAERTTSPNSELALNLIEYF